MTRQQLAAHAGVSTRTLNNWLRPYRRTLRAMGMPDGKAYAAWRRVAEEASERMQQPMHVSRLLEDHATDAQKAAKIDIADFLFCSP